MTLKSKPSQNHLKNDYSFPSGNNQFKTKNTQIYNVTKVTTHLQHTVEMITASCKLTAIDFAIFPTSASEMSDSTSFSAIAARLL